MGKGNGRMRFMAFVGEHEQILLIV
jgi:hypothetical protein